MPKNAPGYPKKLVIECKNGQKCSRPFLHDVEKVTSYHIVHDVEKQDKLSIFENCKEEYYIV